MLEKLVNLISVFILIFSFDLICPIICFCQVQNEKAILFYNEAIDHYRAKNFSEALNLYSKAIVEDPEYINAYYNRANLYMRMEDYKSALADYNSVLRLDPEIAKAWLYKGVAELKMNEDRKALKSFGKALKLDESLELAWEQIALHQLKHESFESAIENLSKAIELNPANPNHFYNRAAANYSLKDYTNAIEDFTKALRIREEKEWYVARGKAYLAIGDVDNALVDFERTDFRNEGNPNLSRLLINSYLEKKDTVRSLEELNHFLKLNDSDIEMRNLRAYLSMQTQDYRQAIDDYSFLIQKFPSDPNHVLNRGIARVLLEYNDSALEDFNAVIALKPDFAEAYFNRAGVLVALGEQEKACEDMRQAAKLGFASAFDHIKSLCRQ